MEGLATLIVVVAVFVANLPALREQWRTDRPGSIKTIWMFGVYCLYVGLGIVVLLLLAPKTGGQGGGGKVLTLHRIHGRLDLLWRAYSDARRAALPRAAGLADAPSASPTSSCSGPRSPASPPISGHKSAGQSECSLNVLGKSVYLR